MDSQKQKEEKFIKALGSMQFMVLVRSGRLRQAQGSYTYETAELIDCPQCGNARKPAFYRGGWCDECLCHAGYLPADHMEVQTQLLFEPIFQIMGRESDSWTLRAKLAKYWAGRKSFILQKGWSFDPILDLRAWDETTVKPCVMCGEECGASSFKMKDYCSSKCYMRAYRSKGKGKIEHLK